MPELGEVEYYRKQWDAGLRKKVTRVELHGKARVLRETDGEELGRLLTGAVLKGSEASGKQMIFRFDTGWLGVHLGMTGELRLESGGHEPGKHDHVVLFQKGRALVFRDARQFGRVRFHAGESEPEWWTRRAPDVLSEDFSEEAVRKFLARRKGAPIKAVLLMQERFPGIGNWMADEVLWRAKIAPTKKAGSLEPAETHSVWTESRFVCREALRIIGTDWSDPPDAWLMNHRWRDGGHCPRCGMELKRAEIGGRTTCWCTRCQK